MAAVAVPTREQAQQLAAELLGEVAARWPHVRNAGRVAATLAPLFDRDEAQLVEAAATLHDIGYSPFVVRTGHHALDGGTYLVDGVGLGLRVSALVAHHSFARISATARGLGPQLARFPHEQGLVADALVFADMHSGPDGRIVTLDERLDDIAARHPGFVSDRRLPLIRASVARVRLALLRAGCDPIELEGVVLVEPQRGACPV